jgi:hypothetical protein
MQTYSAVIVRGRARLNVEGFVEWKTPTKYYESYRRTAEATCDYLRPPGRKPV